MAITDGGITTTMPVAPAGYGNGNDGFGGFGGGWGAWIVIFFLVAMMGWGGNGWGGNNGGNGLTDAAALMALSGNNSGTLPGYSQTNDFSNLERENDIIRSDICQNFANVNQTLANGFQTIQTSFANAELSRSNTQAALMAQIYQSNMDNLQRNCDLTAQINQGFCTTNYNNQSNTRDIIESQNNGTRAILDALTAQRIEAKDERIAELTRMNSALQLAQSQSMQNAYLLQSIRPYPTPAYVVNPPYTVPTTGTGTGADGAARTVAAA